ncbi:tetratricopeptide repeat protein [Vibrio sp. S17_S38]|uniref:cellulose synthase subunit BcsC-related outer membrane protein n=1 Tax=Vibrio sp. S17_S38 TaxID=2720229 RepID=UPI001680413E|nr:cellulose synthase subunit BcsC-related outer membrane protein [Vibrio sp. S17_S38]MBD1574118.1 tetratricopeptide repeat protein [Vibrio sp. S17_S38]
MERLFAIDPNNASGLFFQAQSYVETKHIDKAQAILKKMQISAPSDPETKRLEIYLSIYSTRKSSYSQAQLLSRSGRTDQALSAYQKLFPQGPPTPTLQLEYLKLLDKKPENWQRVQEGLVVLNKEYPGVPDFQLAWAKHTLDENSQDPDALLMVQKLTLNPNTSSDAAIAWLGSLDDQYITKDLVQQYAVLASYMPHNEQMQDAYHDAQKRLVKETDLRKDPTYMDKLAGLALVDADQYRKAEPKLNAAYAARPTDPEILAGLGFVYMKTGRQAKAVEFFTQAKANDPDVRFTDKWDSLIHASAYWANLDKGEAFLAKGQFSNAQKAYMESVNIEPEDPYAYNYLAELALAQKQYSPQKQYSQADKYYVTAISKDPLNETALRGRIDIRVQQKGNQAAYQFAKTLTPAQQHVVQDKTDDLYTTLLLAGVQKDITAGDMKAATLKLDQLAKNPPTSAWSRADIADAYQTTGNPERANQLMAQWSKSPAPEVQFSYALYLSRHGQTAQAIDVLEAVPVSKRNASIDNSLIRLKMGLAFASLSQLAETDRSAAKAKLDQMLLDYSNDPAAQIRLIGMEYRLGFESDAKDDAERLKPSIAWDYSTQLSYGSLLLELENYSDFEIWKSTLPAPKGSDSEQRDYAQQRDMLFAQYAMTQHNYSEAISLYYPISKGANVYQKEAQFGLLAAYQTSGQNQQSEQLAQQLYKEKDSLSGSQIVQLASVLNEQEHTQQALVLTHSTLQYSDLEAYQYRSSMSIAMEHKEYPLSESLAYRALLSDQTDRQAQANPQIQVDDGIAQNHGPQPQTLHQLYDNADDNWLTNSVKSDIDKLHDRNDGYVEFGVDYSGRDSENSATQIPIEVSIPMPKYDGHLLIRTDVVMLDSGDLNYFDKSEGHSSESTFSQKNNGVAFGIGWKANTWSADIGTTPIGFDQTTWVGGLNLSGDLGDLGWKATASRRPETSSTLSYGGMVVPEDDLANKGKHWGNVVSTGVKLGGSYDVGGPVGVWTSAQFHQMTGNNVEDNTRLGLLGGLYWKLIAESDRHLSVGVNSMYLHYDKNLSEYAYGYGGYYSPQQYFSMSLPINWYQRLGNEWSYLVSGSVSNSWTAEDALYGSQGEDEKGGGFGYSLQAAVEKRVSRRWYLGLSMDIQRSDFYEPNHMLMYARYTFSDRWQPIEMPVDPLTLYSDFD